MLHRHLPDILGNIVPGRYGILKHILLPEPSGLGSAPATRTNAGCWQDYTVSKQVPQAHFAAETSDPPAGQPILTFERYPQESRTWGGIIQSSCQFHKPVLLLEMASHSPAPYAAVRPPVAASPETVSPLRCSPVPSAGRIGLCRRCVRCWSGVPSVTSWALTGRVCGCAVRSAMRGLRGPPSRCFPRNVSARRRQRGHAHFELHGLRGDTAGRVSGGF